jgi:glycerol-1-phosphate dehydrogenase [NAD(P)+]
MPTLARIFTAPLAVEIGWGSLSSLLQFVQDQRISSQGRLAMVVGEGLGSELTSRFDGSIPQSDFYLVRSGTVGAALELSTSIAAGKYDCVVGVGGGRTIDVAKYAAGRQGLPMVAVATSLSHDGIGSPVSVLEEDGVRTSHGVPMPLAVIVDLEFVHKSSDTSLRSGIGDVISNINAVADWQLSEEATGEPIDGFAMMLGRMAAEVVISRTDDMRSRRFMAALADALITSGLAMTVAGTSRPCSGSCHEISHAIDLLFPGTASHGEQVAVGALFSLFVRGAKDDAGVVAECLRRYGLPILPQDLGLIPSQFSEAVLRAPETRPDRYTILEHLKLDQRAVDLAVKEFCHAYST